MLSKHDITVNVGKRLFNFYVREPLQHLVNS